MVARDQQAARHRAPERLPARLLARHETGQETGGDVESVEPHAPANHPDALQPLHADHQVERAGPEHAAGLGGQGESRTDTGSP